MTCRRATAGRLAALITRITARRAAAALVAVAGPAEEAAWAAAAAEVAAAEEAVEEDGASSPCPPSGSFTRKYQAPARQIRWRADRLRKSSAVNAFGQSWGE